MIQIAIRLPEEMLEAVDEIIAERFGQPDRTAIIRELLAGALASRKKGKPS
jgi:metal-responsive CopG/Arc/MetJ family transcriptional regulator